MKPTDELLRELEPPVPLERTTTPVFDKHYTNCEVVSDEEYNQNLPWNRTEKPLASLKKWKQIRKEVWPPNFRDNDGTWRVKK